MASRRAGLAMIYRCQIEKEAYVRICGIVNFVESDHVDRTVIERMTDAVAHRGPDDAGFSLGAMGLGHRRLSLST